MKGLLAICALALGVHTSGAQGIVSFRNDTLPTPPDRLVRDNCGRGLVGTSYSAQLLYGTTPDNLTPHPTLARFRQSAAPGTWVGGSRTLSGIAPPPGPPPSVGPTIYLQVRVWDTNFGAAFEQARQAGSPWGQSSVFPYAQKASDPADSLDVSMINFPGFTVAGSCAAPGLSIRQGDAQIEILFDGQQPLDVSDDLTTWTPLGPQVSPFRDPAAASRLSRFYRINNGAGLFSSNVVGFYRLVLCEGFSLIANQLDSSNNAISNLFQTPPDGTHFYKFDPTSRVFNRRAFVGGAWEGDELDLALNPGEGAFVYSPVALIHTFLGQVRAALSVPIPQGFSILSSPVPQAGHLDDPAPSGLGFPPQPGDTVYQWNCQTRHYGINSFVDGSWEGDNDGAPPSLSIGEAFFLYRSTVPGHWHRTFSAGP